MKRNYKYEREILHWLDGGKIEQRYIGNDFVTKEWFKDWKQFYGDWIDSPDWQYRIAEKPKEEQWLYVNKTRRHPDPTDASYIQTTIELSTDPTPYTIGKIRMEDV